MTRWTMIPEYIALLLIMVIMLFFYDKRRDTTFRRRLYWTSLWMAQGSIALNILCVYTIAGAIPVPLWMNILLNSLYFWVNVLMSGVVAFYLFYRILEYVYEKHCMKKAVIGLSVLMSLYTLLILWNLKSGVVFYFDAQGQYQRGIFNRLGYLVLLLEIIMVCICYFRNRRSVTLDMRRIIGIILPLVAFVGILQVTVLRDVLLNGTIIAIAELVILLGLQSRPMEQDSLTGLGSRKSFFEELSLRADGGQSYQIISVALRNFGIVSQKVGHKKGDDLLIQVSRFLSQLHPDCRAYRTRNVEFSVLLPWTSDQEQEQFIDKVLQRMRDKWYVEKIACELPFHVGSITCRNENWSAEQVMQNLEYTLQLAKNEQRECARFDDEASYRLHREKYLLDTMRVALEEQRFQVWYQPIYHNDKGRFASAEALLRLTDPQGNPISPGEFIPLAEKKGMLDDLTWVVLEKICTLLGSGAVPGLEQVSLNISMRQFLQPDLLERIEEQLTLHRVDPRRLKLEITERVLLEDQDYIRRTMQRMKDRGIGFYLDDFGTGYANFSSVLDLPFEVIKLDRTILADHPDKPKAQVLPAVLIPFFHNLGYQVVAEGVESRDQVQRMLQCGADRLQGFYYARPMREQALIGLFREQKVS